VFDLGSRPPLIEAVVAVDMALHDGLVGRPDLQQWAADHTGSKRIRQFRSVIELAEPLTESPMETRMRMTLVLNGLPRPQAQVPLHDAQGRFLGRADLYYPSQRLILEYDGGTHRTSLVEDNRRQNRLINAGYTLLRFTIADIRDTPDTLVTQVRAALHVKPRKSQHHDTKRCNASPS
jgi:very-short-patch-repair endonuclease